MPNNLLDDILDNASEDEERLAEAILLEDAKLAPLLEEINLIEEQSVRLFVRSVMLKADNFWVIPSSFAPDRPPDELFVGGNVLHTKRVARIVKLMAESEGREQIEVDLLLAAALIHDVTKGVEWNGDITYDPMHPYTLDGFVKNVIDDDTEHLDQVGRSSTLYLDDQSIARILRIARCHLGFWSPIPETYPISTPDWILHWADVLASQLHVIIDGNSLKMNRWILDEPEVFKETALIKESTSDSEGSDVSQNVRRRRKAS